MFEGKITSHEIPQILEILIHLTFSMLHYEAKICTRYAHNIVSVRSQTPETNVPTKFYHV